MVDIFKYDDYRSFLKAKVESEKNNWGLWARIASAAGCQPTYLSQVIKGKAHCTQEHIIGIANFFEFSENEKEFFMLMVDLARAGSKSLQDFFSSKMIQIRKQREDIAQRLEIPRLELGARESLYYSAWYYSAIHVIVTLPKFKTADAIAKRLLLPVEQVQFALEQLEAHSVVKRNGKNWDLGKGDIHIPKESPMVGVNHNNWRQRAVMNSMNPSASSVHYTAVYSLSLSDFQHLKEKLLDYIEHSRKVVAPSKEEEIICLTCDLFQV